MMILINNTMIGNIFTLTFLYTADTYNNIQVLIDIWYFWYIVCERYNFFLILTIVLNNSIFSACHYSICLLFSLYCMCSINNY